jgi:hypothetical protein
MKRDCKANISEDLRAWSEQIQIDPSFTESDVEELRGHLIDLIEELAGRGLNEKEAFIIAAARLGDVSDLKSEFEEVNTSIIQMRKTILLFSGILVFFIFYFLLFSSSRLLVLVLHQIKNNSVLNVRYILIYIIVYQLFFIFITLYLYFSRDRIVKKVESLKINPNHTMGLFSGIIIFALSDHWFRQLINSTFEPGSYTYNHLYTIFDYSGYSFPFVMIICFVLLYKHYYLITNRNDAITCFSEHGSQGTEDETNNPLINFIGEEQIKNQNIVQFEELKKMGLDDEEAFVILSKRMEMGPPSNIDYNKSSTRLNSMYNLLIIFSGILVYFFLYFLLFSSSRILFTILQYFENDPVLNIKRTWSYILFYQLLCIFFTASIYFLDSNVVKRLRNLKIKPRHTYILLVSTIFLAIIDRCFYPISRNTIGGYFELKYKFLTIFSISNYTFPFILFLCFIVLFHKYYRQNVALKVNPND